jgi:uncharacterized protein (TIRG00374 family)
MAEAGVWKRRLLTAGKYGLGIAALVWVIYTADVERTIDAVGRLSAATLAFVVFVSIISVLARVATWHVLVSFFTDVDLRQLLTADLIIKFINSLFPSRFSGRSIAPLALRHFTGLAWTEAIAVTVAHTGMFAVLYGFVTLFGVVTDAESYGSGLTAVILLSASAYLAVGGAVVLAGWRLDVFDRLVDQLAQLISRFPAGHNIAKPLHSFRSKLLEGSDAQFQQLVRDPSTVGLFVVTWIVAILLIPAVRIWILLSATGVSGFDPLFLPLYVVVAYSVTVLPLTPGGIGVTEATAVAVFIALGVPEGAIVTVVFLDRVFGVYLPSLFGWLPLIRTDFTAVIE